MPLSSVSEDITACLKTYEASLKKWQKAINLVGPKTLDDSWNRHFIDSAQIERYIPQNAIIAEA